MMALYLVLVMGHLMEKYLEHLMMYYLVWKMVSQMVMYLGSMKDKDFDLKKVGMMTFYLVLVKSMGDT